MRLTQEYTSDIEHRFKYATLAALALFLAVAGRLYYLQVMRGGFYRSFSTENSIKEIEIPAARGMILDRRGQLLVDNRPSFNIAIIPQYVVNPRETFKALNRLLGIPTEGLEEIWQKRAAQPYYQPLFVKKDASLTEVSLIRGRKLPWPEEGDPFDLRGVEIVVDYQRVHPGANIASHALGYVKEIDPARLKRYREERTGEYRPGDMVGVGGIEEAWDETVRGADGFEERIVNAMGREVDYQGIASELAKRPAVAGASLKLTLDRDLQTLARDLFGARKGAAVAIDVRTGGIVTMFSSPSYDLNALSGPEGTKYWNQISASPEKYLLNRAIQGGYPPGSTYKIVTAIAALSEGVVRPDETVRCGGALVFGGRPYHCWRKGGHGAISLHKAIVSSCDVYFYTMGLRLGVDRLARYAGIMNLGQPTGVDIPGERGGLIPTSEWKLKRFGVPWQEGETLSISVGQGYDVLTPIQNAMVAALVAGGGTRPRLHMVEEAIAPDGRIVHRWEAPAEPEALPIDPAVLKRVREAMVGVVAEPDGTAHAQSVRKVTMGGKTGTAQVVQLDGSAVCRGEICRDHAWFIGFAPADTPEIAAAAVVEHGGFGASAAAQIVGALLQRYWEIEHGS